MDPKKRLKATSTCDSIQILLSTSFPPRGAFKLLGLQTASGVTLRWVPIHVLCPVICLEAVWVERLLRYCKYRKRRGGGDLRGYEGPCLALQRK